MVPAGKAWGVDVNGKGFIKVPRAMLNEWRDILTAEEVGMLIYLAAAANYQVQPVCAPKGDILKRGQLVISIRSLAKRFDISKSKAARLLDKWEGLGLIKRRTVFGTESGTPNGTLLTLEFYESSQGVRDSIRDSFRDEKGDSIRIKNKKEKKGEEDMPPPPSHGYGFYHNVVLTEDEYRELKSHIPAELLDDRINKASQGIHDKWKGYEGSHFDVVRKWAVADGCWKEQPDRSPKMSELTKKKMDLIERFGRYEYDRAVATVETNDPKKVKDYLESKIS